MPPFAASLAATGQGRGTAPVVPLGKGSDDVNTKVRIARVQAQALRCPIETPVATSFGIMRDRPAVFVRIEDSDGCFGWGEVFANWPAAGAEHRVNLLRADLADLVSGFEAQAPGDLFDHLRHATRLRALQCGESGPFRQVIAGLDIAMWDLFARRAGVPLRRLLDPAARDRVPVYASGIHSAAAAGPMARARAEGYAHFKVKVGFDLDRDIASVLDLCRDLRGGETLAADANQAWDLPTARAFVDGVGARSLHWLEEPLAAFAPPDDWQALAAAAPMPLAGGENIAGFADFGRTLARGYLGVVQPDVAKWGGCSGCLQVARQVLDSGARYCPHFLGGGIGLAASAAVLAAAGGDGLLEVDVNPNPLREAFEICQTALSGAGWQFDDAPGLGIETLPDEVGRYQTAFVEL
ncbi:mandelate racemase/muconate lactonizing enzyme family protein [Ponticoccus sp. SC2-23]|uniref:enolase C-terminal domain-like protein n=1 Tax=Alexandriicola marinus TaxID=2081710 RepID=UPI000FDC09B3|nr:enolase C-terminal domain-like protein [Alexandriicola marinus]MBM1221259.1 mandelate racemase/muconate lactonizing enzyme family protein [Ponticoccus sp. SC6-9]MBM1225829.1 mandelate racemase/muconate lactonizing enzyme family protein [Ponticoccus sp. SC6-15]MBM1227981.1 mandelate racemase/muconate lactonizing enzyme family protein [Ponticoccus sp. SC6-38]MBM1234381.1 mandelate racemase/muconate lactonizing enzyme family protein [Ponticoccus sp. SC6-45]MBM1238483.1 mandelate racemase/mucon